MTGYELETALKLLKARLNRLEGDTSLDETLTKRLEETTEELEHIGITLDSSTRDMMLVVDYAAWKYQNRDKGTQMPEWLKRERFERWLESGAAG